MSTQLHNAATWPRTVRQHIEAVAATLMLGLQVFRERAMNLGGSLSAIASTDAKDEKIRRFEAELDLHRRRLRNMFATDCLEYRADGWAVMERSSGADCKGCC